MRSVHECGLDNKSPRTKKIWVSMYLTDILPKKGSIGSNIVIIKIILIVYHNKYYLFFPAITF